LRLYDNLSSGNGYKVRLLLRQLGIPFDRVDLDITRGESRTAEFLERNPNGRIPVLELDSGAFLWESNAILYYLADSTAFFPKSRVARSRALQWMFFEQYSHEPYIAVVRHWIHTGLSAGREAEIEERRSRGHAALGVMQRHLADHEYFVDDRYSIADIALYAYTHVAHEGGFDLSGYPAIGVWLDRVRTQPGHTPIDEP